MKAQHGTLWETSQSGCSGASQLQILLKISPLSLLPYGQTNQYGVSDDKWSQVLKCHGLYLHPHESLFLKLSCPITNKPKQKDYMIGQSPVRFHPMVQLRSPHSWKSICLPKIPTPGISYPSLHLSWCTDATCPCPNPLLQDPWVARKFGGGVATRT